MDWFDSEEEIVVESSALQVFGNDVLPSTVDTAIAEMVFEGKDFSQSLLESSVNSRFNYFKRFLEYGKTEYSLGLPTFEFASNSELEGLVAPSLGISPDALVYVHTGDLNLGHVAWDILTRDFSYNHSSNELEGYVTPSGAGAAFIDDIEVYLPGYDPEQLPSSYSWSTTPIGASPRKSAVRNEQPILEEAPTELPQVFVRVAYVEADGEVKTDIVELDVSGYAYSGFYFMAHYVIEDAHHYLTYRSGTGTLPSLDFAEANAGTSVDLGDFYPVVPFIADGKYLASDADKETPEYQERVALLRTLSLDYQELADGIYENAQSNDVQQAVFTMGVALRSEHPTERAYLFNFFDKLYENLNIQDTTAISGRFLSDSYTDGYRLSYSEGDYLMSLTFSSISRKLIAGTIGEVGECTSEFYTQTKDVNTGVRVNNLDGRKRINVTTSAFRKQIMSGVYYEIQIDNLSQHQTVYKGERDHIKYDDASFILPLDHALVKQLDHRTRDNLLYRSMYFVINAYDKETVEWYEQTWFAQVLIVIAIVVTVISLGATWQALTVAWAAGTAAFALAVLVIILKVVVIRLVSRWVAQQLGPKWGLILAVVLAVASFASDESGLMSAENLMMASTSLTEGVNAVNEEEIKNIMKEYERERALFEERMDEIEEIEEMLKTPELVDAYMFIGQEPLTVAGESPSGFYDRTIHNGNPGTLCYDYLHNYFDVNLQLPKANME